MSNAIAIYNQTLMRLVVEALAVDFWNSFFCFYWNSNLFFIELVTYFFFQTFLGEWGGAREGQAPRTLYMHICIWKNEISTSFYWNINQLIFTENEISTSKKTNLSSEKTKMSSQ